MKLEVGKTYLNDYGNSVEIIRMLNHGSFIGILTNDENKEICVFYDKDGRTFIERNNIVREKPTVKTMDLYINLSRHNGEFIPYLYTNEYDANKCKDEASNFSQTKVTVNFEEGAKL